MDKNEFWALTGESMLTSGKEKNNPPKVRVSNGLIEAKVFSVVVVDHDRGRSFREFEFLKGFKS